MNRFITLFRPYARFLVAIWVILIIIFAVMTDLPDPRIIRGNFEIRLDYPIHFLEHTSLALLAMIAFITDKFLKQVKKSLYLLAGLILFAIFTEMLQLLVPARSFELRDMGLNILGSLTGTLFTMILYRRM